MSIIERAAGALVARLWDQYPVLTVTGPRQSGKTTLCRSVFGELAYHSLENPDTRRLALSDPRTFLHDCSEGMVIDEVQRAPELLSYIQSIVDETGSARQFVLTGSAQFELLESVTQSLAGRTALLRLLPFSFGEIYGGRTVDISQMLYTGFYPRIHDKDLNPTEALRFYAETYVERDVRTLLNVRELTQFDTFLRMAAGRTAGVLNLSSLGNDCGLSHNTAKGWISVLEASYIVFRLRPHFRNFSKRLVKSPKLHFYDSGLACYLLGIHDPGQIQLHPQYGALFESCMVSELIKQRFNAGQENNLYYWRDNIGHEIDVVMDFGNALLPVEIKASRTVNQDFFKNINFYRKINPDSTKAAIIYGGDKTFVENTTWVVGYRDIGLFEGLDYNLEIGL